MSEMEYYITKLKENISRDNGKGAVADRGVRRTAQIEKTIDKRIE